jgi:hypothetical protein
MLRTKPTDTLLALLGSISALLLVNAAGAQGVASQSERFGKSGKLYSVAASSGETEKFYLLTKRTLPSEDGVYYDGTILRVEEVPGGGYANSENAFSVTCSSDNPIMVSIGFEPQKKETAINPSLKSPPQESRHPYNLWWAACRNQFQKFR